MKSHSAISDEHGKCGMTVIRSFSQSYVAVHFMFWLYFTVLWTNANEIPNILATSSIMTLLFQGQVFICFGCWSTSQVFGNFIREASIFHLLGLLTDISIVSQFRQRGPRPLLLQLGQRSKTFVFPIFCPPKCTYNIFKFTVTFLLISWTFILFSTGFFPKLPYDRSCLTYMTSIRLTTEGLMYPQYCLRQNPHRKF